MSRIGCKRRNGVWGAVIESLLALESECCGIQVGSRRDVLMRSVAGFSERGSLRAFRGCTLHGGLPLQGFTQIL